MTAPTAHTAVNALPRVPAPVNEPAIDWVPGSAEDQALQAELDRVSAAVTELHHVIGGEHVTTGETNPVVAPHDHAHVLATLPVAEPKHVQLAIEAALAARGSWSRLPWWDRAAVFTRAAELITGKYRLELTATTMLGQAKTYHQAEIDVCELADFLRYNAHSARIISDTQPDSVAGEWNYLDQKPLEGFVLAISPFNFTAISGNLPATPALMGNVVVWKPAEKAALSAQVVMRVDLRGLGRDEEALRRIGDFVELHVEQGRGLVDLAAPVALGSSILGHGRWRLEFRGQGNHAGTTLMADRADPVVAAALATVAVRDAAAATPGARATVGRFVPVPGGTNVIASRAGVWLDARHEDDAVTAALVERIRQEALRIAVAEGCTATMTQESLSPTAHFDRVLTADLGRVLGDPPVLTTGAGHDAGVLAAHTRTAMLFVRNPSGVSHSPEEHVEDADALAGVDALADVLHHLLREPAPTGSARDA